MSKLVVRWLAGFAAMIVINGAIAALLIGPLLESRYESVVRSSPAIGALVGGYLLIAAALVVVHHTAGIGRRLGSASMIGGVLGLAVFAGTHMVQAGYTNLDTFGWIASGVLDAAGPLAGMLAIALVSRDSESSVASPASDRP